MIFFMAHLAAEKASTHTQTRARAHKVLRISCPVLDQREEKRQDLFTYGLLITFLVS